MLREILSVSGRPGLCRLLSQGKNSLIVESLSDKRRTPIHANERVVSLAEIAIYTTEGEKPLGEVFELMYAASQGKTLDIKALSQSKETLFAYMGSVLPNFDTVRVYPTDVKKLISWYNTLVQNGFTQFVEEKKQDSPAE